MKKKKLSIFIVTLLTASSLFTFVGCQNSNTEVTKKEATVENKAVETKLEDNKIVIGDDNKELKEDVKESEEPKEEETKKEETKKEDSKKEDTSSKGNKKDEVNKNEDTSSSSGNSGGSSKPKPEPEPTPAPEPKPEPKPEPTPAPEPEPEPEPYWVEEVGHWEQVMVDDAWDEYIYEIHAICSDCGADITGQTGTHWCGGLKGWHSEEVIVDTIHHDAIYEDRWVVDVPGHWEYK